MLLFFLVFFLNKLFFLLYFILYIFFLVLKKKNIFK